MRTSYVPDRWASKIGKPLMAAASAAALSLGLIALGSATSSASAAGIGSGRALVRIDAPNATVSKNADGSYVLTVPANSTGQFFGERPDKSGKKSLRVGDVSAKQLIRKWQDFRYTSAGVPTTIAWNAKKASTMEGILVRLFKPTVTPEGITFRFTTKQYAPESLKDVTVNLQRAPERSSRTTYTVQNTVTLSGNMKFFAGFYDGGKVDTHLMNGSSYCWSYAFGAEGTETIPNESCAGIPQWGGSVTWKENPPTCPGCLPNDSTGVYLYTNLQPSGQDAFVYNQQILYIDEW